MARPTPAIVVLTCMLFAVVQSTAPTCLVGAVYISTEEVDATSSTRVSGFAIYSVSLTSPAPTPTLLSTNDDLGHAEYMLMVFPNATTYVGLDATMIGSDSSSYAYAGAIYSVSSSDQLATFDVLGGVITHDAMWDGPIVSDTTTGRYSWQMTTGHKSYIASRNASGATQVIKVPSTGILASGGGSTITNIIPNPYYNTNSTGYTYDLATGQLMNEVVITGFSAYDGYNSFVAITDIKTGAASALELSYVNDIQVATVATTDGLFGTATAEFTNVGSISLPAGFARLSEYTGAYNDGFSWYFTTTNQTATIVTVIGNDGSNGVSYGPYIIDYEIALYCYSS